MATSREDAAAHAELQQRLQNASDLDLMKAAEAVVDAALSCHSQRNSFHVTESTREVLISAVLKNPALTAHLFNEDSLRVLCQR